ncbi:MAG: CHAT domain-containing protein [Saprospiraceae bacterium]|nr:CHAT domain-containing protein [Saprospiraceae bacterium]MBK9722531.1 CHAT domain-containing protein [Saprospiraceae bacterium]
MKIFINILMLVITTNAWAQSVDTIQVRSEVDSLIKQSRVLTNQQQFDLAIQLLDSAILVSKTTLGPDHAYFAKSVFNKAYIFYVMGKLDEAIQLYFQAEEIQKNYLGRLNASYANTINNIGIIYYLKDNYALAEKYYVEAKEIRGEVLGINSKEYSGSLNNLALLYRLQGDNPKSIKMFLEAKEIWKGAKNKLDPGYAHIINNIGLGYVYLGDYEKAEPLFFEAQEIWEKTVGKAHPDYALSLDCLGFLYNTKGDYAKAEPIYNEVIKSRLNAFGKDHVEYASAINNLATLYMKKGDYRKGETLCIEAKDIREKLMGREHNDYAESLINLANLYTLTLQYDKVEILLLEAKSIWEKSLGKEHTQYSIAIQNLANHYFRLKEYKKAEPLYFEAISIRSKAYGTMHEFYAAVIYNLATMYLEMGNYDQAEKLTMEAKEIWSNAFGKENENYINTLGHLNAIYQGTNRTNQCAAIVFEMNELVRKLIEKAATYSSENQMLAYLQTFERSIGQIQSFSQSYKSPELSKMAFNNALFYNGYLLENTQRLARSVSGIDTLLQVTFKNWKSSQRKLSIEFAKPISERKYIAEIEAEVEVYEKQLTQLSPQFKNARAVPSWEDVRNTLLPGTAAIEFVHFNEISQNNETKTKYAALLVKYGETQPYIIPLFEESKLYNIISSNKEQANSELLAQLYSRGISPAKSVSLAGLYDIIWKPLDSILQNTTTVYYCPSGLLHRINFGAIPLTNNMNLSDKFNLKRLRSTRSLVISDSIIINITNETILYGGIDFETDKEIVQQDTFNHQVSLENQDEITFSLVDRSASKQTDKWNYLPGTKKEIFEIAAVLKDINYKTITFSDTKATEESFKEIGKTKQSPRVLHLATHGYFYPDPKTTNKQTASNDLNGNAFKLSDHPMLRSGLILAGGNAAWEGQPSKGGREDGILTAYEISQMNLSNTELVVLSACETGLGDIQGNEGVFGLQRAFKIAGAKYLMMSLWQVPDEETKEFMISFYKNWLIKKHSIPNAFRKTQQEMRKRFEDPYKWAGFVLVE